MNDTSEIRNISSLDRMIEIVNSMRQPMVEVGLFNFDGKNEGVPQLTIYATNSGGVYMYKYVQTGLIGLKEARKKFYRGVEYN